MEKSLISIIVPVYNVEQYVKCCVESIIQQTYKNLEIILVNDGSTDNSGYICDDLAKNDNRLRVIHQENKGLSAARNSGVSIAKGKYIGFVDSDDYINVRMYEKLYVAIEKYNADIAYCNHMEVDHLKSADIYNKQNGNSYLYSQIEFQTKMLNHTVHDFVWNRLYSREIIKDFLPVKICEDTCFTLQCAFDVKKIVYVDEVLYYYYKRPDSLAGYGLFLDLSMLDAEQYCIDLCKHYKNLVFLKHRLRLTSAHAINLYYQRIEQEKNLSELPIIRKKIFGLYLKYMRHYRLMDHIKLMLFFCKINPYKLFSLKK